uniref:Uncharacterized protein n=1 Tax=viral metagenome TaxID=1070528 RepID=A0A6M3LJW2_9ZZZZ
MDVQMKKVSQERFLELQRGAWKSASEAGLPKGYLGLLSLETTGGACPMCGKVWQMVTVNNHFAEFVYYDPACGCYARCPSCRASWHRELAMGSAEAEIRQCPSCGWVRNPVYGRICVRCGEGYTSPFQQSYYGKCPDCEKKYAKSERTVQY